MTWQVRVAMPSGGTKIADVLDSNLTHLLVQFNDWPEPQQVHRSHIINEKESNESEASSQPGVD